MKRIVLGVVLLFLLVVLGGWPSSVSASAPRQQGWWTSSPVPRPDAPDDGLVVEGGVAAPTSYAALVYDVGEGATVGALTLAVAADSATTPNSSLQACPLDEAAIQPEQGGAMADAPAYDCGTSVTAGPASDGASYELDVASLVRDGVLAVAIVPSTPADRVVLAAPGDDSLAVQRPAATPSGDPAGEATVPAPAASPPPASSNDFDVEPAPVADETPTTTVSVGRTERVAASPELDEIDEVDDGLAERGTLLLVLAGGIVLLGGWLAVGRNAAMRAAN